MLEHRRVGVGCVEAGQARRRQPIPRRLPLSPRRLQPVAEGHQFIDFGDDAVLFGEGWNRNLTVVPEHQDQIYSSTCLV